jgi:septum site-determining protein MinC
MGEKVIGTSSQTASVSIKGIRDGLLLTVRGAETWDQAAAAVVSRIDQTADFFRGARVALDLGDLTPPADALAGLRQTLDERRVTLWTILGTDAITTAAQAAGLNVALPATSPDREKTDEDVEVIHEEVGEAALLISHTLRSGRSVRYAGHIIVMGDVNPGAEIVATGNIIVWGRLRGVAHAGADGDERAVVCALDLQPTQLRIAGRIATAPGPAGQPQPEIARVRDDRIVAERWSGTRTR